MKILHLIIGLIFLLFAMVQWNDPDSLLWILLYLLIALVAFLAFKGHSFYWPYFAFSLFLLVLLLMYVPDVIAWFRDGMPSITTSMKASTLYIELVREFFGLLISLIAMTFYLAISKKKMS